MEDEFASVNGKYMKQQLVLETVSNSKLIVSLFSIPTAADKRWVNIEIYGISSVSSQ